MSEFAWAAVAPPRALPKGFLPLAREPLPRLFDADAPTAVGVPGLPDAPLGADEPLVEVDTRLIGNVDVYARSSFPHTAAGAFLRLGAAQRLVSVAAQLPQPWGLAVFDAWRDPGLQSFLYHRAYDEPGLPPGFVSPPSPDPRTPPPHATGGTVDLTLTFEGQPLALGTDFDEFTLDAFTASLEAQPGVARDLRRVLYRLMADQGFVVLAREWWHFEYGTRLWATVKGRPALYPAAVRPV
ncbi:MAG: M15 family metallopeptidase [Candidatus Nanopelagicales bacterium]